MTATQRKKYESYLSFEFVKIENFGFVIYTAQWQSITTYKNTTI